MAGNAVVFFEEAIQQKNDYLAMYNLAHIYIYNEAFKKDINKAFKLLAKSSEKFYHSIFLLCLLLIKQFGFDLKIVSLENEKTTKEHNNVNEKIYQIISNFNLRNMQIFKSYYESYRSKDFLYNLKLEPILSYELEKKSTNENITKNPNVKDISYLFYEGFGLLL